MREILVVVGKRADRFDLYRKLNPELVVFGEVEIAKQFETKATIWSSKLTLKQKTQTWLDILAQKNRRPVLATRSGVFLPFQKLSIAIIDDPHHPGHYEQQSPRYQTFAVAQTLTRVHEAKLIAGTPVLTVADYYHLKTGRYKNFPLPSWSMPKILIRASHQSNLDTPEVGESRHLGSILYFLPRKGEYRGFVCRDCNSLQAYPMPSRCQNCHSTRLKPYGIGTIQLAKQLGATVIDQNHPVPEFRIRNSEFGIVVATHKIFDYDLEFDTTIVTNFDHLLHLPDPFQNEYIFATLVKLAQITKKQLIIETRFPDHPAIANLNNWRQFYEQELKLRQFEKLPPFSRLIKLTAKTKLAVPALPKTAIVSPIHQNFEGQYQIIVKLRPGANLDRIAKQISRWKLEPDPANLL